MQFIRLQNVRFGLATNSSSSHSMVSVLGMLTAPDGMTVTKKQIGYNTWPEKAAAVLYYASAEDQRHISRAELTALSREILGEDAYQVLDRVTSLGTYFDDNGPFFGELNDLIEQSSNPVEFLREYLGPNCPLRDPHIILLHLTYDGMDGDGDLERLLTENLTRLRKRA